MSTSSDPFEALTKLLGDPDSAAEVARLIDSLAVGKASQLAQDDSRSPHRIETLASLFTAYAGSETKFEPGNMVQWKAGMKNRRVPAYGEPAVVVEVVDPPIFGAEESHGSAYFREPLSLRLGLVDDDGEFLVFHFDGNRFERFPPE